ncbi:MAG: hypothetical protein IT555_12885 [Acetobacteraceae bacterium]|nr:hypothetical protein [Acetobacteraceae bacterium]
MTTPVWLEVAKIIVSALKEIAWPLAAGLIAFAYRSDIRSLLPRVSKAGLSGVELDPIQSQQKVADSNKPPGQLKQLPGLSRTLLIEEVEKNLHKELEEIKEDDRITLLVRVLAQSRLETLFERIYRVIFGSQIDGLKKLKSMSSVSLDEARNFFETYRIKNPEVYTDYGFDGWIGFLINEKLIMLENDRVSITEIGRDFLTYLGARGLRLTKPF